MGATPQFAKPSKPAVEMVLLRGIGPPTPSLPMTCSTTELQQRIHFSGTSQYVAPEGKIERGKCHSSPPMASPDCYWLNNLINNCEIDTISPQ
jgi:hypothetical protein